MHQPLNTTTPSIQHKRMMTLSAKNCPLANLHSLGMPITAHAIYLGSTAHMPPDYHLTHLLSMRLNHSIAHQLSLRAPPEQEVKLLENPCMAQCARYHGLRLMSP